MPATPETYTGEDAKFMIGTKDHTALGMGDFSLTISRDTNELELTGSAGNYYAAGSISVDGSFTASKLAHDDIGAILGALINGTVVSISGQVGDKSLHFNFASGMITGFDLSIGDRDTFTQGSIDFTLKKPYLVNTVTNTSTGGTYISDH